MLREEIDCIGEYIWNSDLEYPSVQAAFNRLQIRTYGEAALLSEVKLEESGVERAEMYPLKNLLAKRGMSLSPDAETVTFGDIMDT